MRLAIPPAFRLPPGRETRLAWVESEAVSSLLAHKADAEQIGVIEVMVETAIRALNLAPKRPKHCAHLEPAMLEEGLRIMHRAGYAVDHAKTRQKATGIYGLDAADRKAITDFADWHAALNARGAIPRAIWIQALGLCVKGSGVKLKPLDELEAA